MNLNETTGSGLVIVNSTASLAKCRKNIKWCGLLAAVVCTFMLLFPFRQSAGALINSLYKASESLNSYAYQMINVEEGVSAVSAVVVLLLGITGLSLYSAAAFSAVPALMMALTAAGVQIYFGLSLPVLAEIILFGLVGLKLKKSGSIGCFASVLVVSVAVAMLLFPGVDENVEELSERARDYLSTVFINDSEESAEIPDTISETRPENLRVLENGMEEAATGDAYELITVEQVEISKPDNAQIIRIILMCLMIPVLLFVPFVPFVWFSARRRRAEILRAELFNGNCSERIDCLFMRVNNWLDLLNEGSQEALFANRFDGAVSGSEYINSYKHCVLIWQEAVYSRHTMSEEQAAELKLLLEETEKIMYEKADRMLRFRLRYILCLYSQEMPQ